MSPKALTVGQLWAVQALTECETLPDTLRLPPWLPQSGKPTSGHLVWQQLLEGKVIDEGGAVDPIIARRLAVLNRPDLEVALSVNRWHEDGTMRELLVSLVRQGPTWVAATRKGWLADPEMSPEKEAPADVDEVVLSSLGDHSGDGALRMLAEQILAVAGEAEPMSVPSINAPAKPLLQAVSTALSGGDGLSALGSLGLSPEQAKVVVEAGHPFAPRVTVTAIGYPSTGKVIEQTVVSLIETEYGRTLYTSKYLGGDWSDDVEWWVSLYPATTQRLSTELGELLARTPAGQSWASSTAF